MGFLQGKRALITGIASQRSIASGIAEAMHREGAELAFTYQNDKLKSRVEAAAAEYGSEHRDPAGRRRRRADRRLLRPSWASTGTASTSSCTPSRFAPREAIAGEFLDGLTRENFAHRPRHLRVFAGGAGQGRAADDAGPQRRAS